mmetsp:Transcript_10056/g.21228  ORF Transcript_10056/g.21228 Transcript_10056/m.21228 type:complete len:343 (-) Transcript_10056:42-1070(-)
MFLVDFTMRLIISARAFSFLSILIAPHSYGASREITFREMSPLARVQGIERNALSSIAVGELHSVQAQAKLGSVEAFYILGLFNLYGLHPLKMDEETALNWLQKATKEGHNDAQCAVGILLYHGHGNIEVDQAMAKSFFRSASNDGHAYGHWLLGQSLFQEASSLISKNDERKDKLAEAASLFHLVAERIPQAAHQLAIMYEYGLIEVEETAPEKTLSHLNLLKAAELYEIASRRGFVQSLYHLALMHVYGRGVAQDYTVAAELFRNVASNHERPHAPSMRYLAILQANGHSNSASIPDYDAALMWYGMCIATDDFTDVHEMCVAEHKALSDVINTARAKTQ